VGVQAATNPSQDARQLLPLGASEMSHDEVVLATRGETKIAALIKIDIQLVIQCQEKMMALESPH
jgi:hypothetical protein